MTGMFRIAIIALGFFGTGCVSLLPEVAPAKPRYHIQTAETELRVGEMVQWTLSIDDPHTSRVYDIVKIAVATGPGKIEYFAGGEWTDRAPRLFQTALVQTFQDSGSILTVGDRQAIPIADYILQTDIRKLELDVQSGSPIAKVSVYARLTDGKGTVYAAKRFAAQRDASNEEADTVVAVLNDALNEVIGSIAEWTFEEGNQHQAANVDS